MDCKKHTSKNIPNPQSQNIQAMNSYIYEIVSGMDKITNGNDTGDV